MSLSERVRDVIEVTLIVIIVIAIFLSMSSLYCAMFICYVFALVLLVMLIFAWCYCLYVLGNIFDWIGMRYVDFMIFILTKAIEVEEIRKKQ